tara:strand:- start:49 stop:660 length:612 start_codon:yes stop_codon:yes gene_type:complete
MKHIYILLFVLPLIGFGQTDFSVVPEKLGDYFYVSNNPKSLTNFKFRIPEGFQENRDGRDNNVIKIFTKTISSNRLDISGNIINSSQIEFGITVLKWRDDPKYKIFQSMSNSEIKEMTESNLEKRDGTTDPNEFFRFYKKNNLWWSISGSWNTEKNLYLIMTSLYTHEQSIQLSFLTNTKEDIREDIKNIKKLIDSFEYIGEQ